MPLRWTILFVSWLPVECATRWMWTGRGRDVGETRTRSEGRLQAGGRGRDDDQLVTLALGRLARRGVLHQMWHELEDGSGRLERAGLSDTLRNP